MRTEKEIAKWLRNKSWFVNYVTCLFKYSIDKTENRNYLSLEGKDVSELSALDFLMGKAGESTIQRAFSWVEAAITDSLSWDEWNEIHNEFMDWYSSKTAFKNVKVGETFTHRGESFIKVTENKATLVSDLVTFTSEIDVELN